MGTRLAHTLRSRCHPQMGRRHRLARPPPHKPPPKQLGLTLHQLFLSFNPRRARPLCVPVGGGPPARSPHASLRLGVVDLEARPGPATTHRHRGLAPPARTGTAASPAYNAIPAAASARSYVGVEPLFRAADHVEASSHDVRHRGSAPGLAANRRAMTAPSNA